MNAVPRSAAAAGDWLRGGHHPRPTRDAGVRRSSISNTARSDGAPRCRSYNDGDQPHGRVGPGATGTRDRPDDPATRGIGGTGKVAQFRGDLYCVPCVFRESQDFRECSGAVCSWVVAVGKLGGPYTSSIHSIPNVQSKCRDLLPSRRCADGHGEMSSRCDQEPPQKRGAMNPSKR